MSSWGLVPYVDLRLSGTLPVAAALTQLYVLLPVLDDSKHYWVGEDEVDKLLRAGGAWLAGHPERELITRRFLGPGRLALEITESQLPHPAVGRAMVRLRELGVRIAIDDFGTGHSSLAQLAARPVGVLELDQAFLQTAGSAHGGAVMTAVVALARAMGLLVIAEGIEQPGQADDAARAGVDLAQGHLFSRPAPAADVARWFQPVPSGRHR